MNGPNKVLEVFGNRAWIECGMDGNAHVFVQSDAPNSKPVKVCTVFYDYLYADNSTKRTIARTVAAMYDSRPIEERWRATETGPIELCAGLPIRELWTDEAIAGLKEALQVAIDRETAGGGEVMCRICGQPTMHVGDECYACIHSDQSPATGSGTEGGA